MNKSREIAIIADDRKSLKIAIDDLSTDDITIIEESVIKNIDNVLLVLRENATVFPKRKFMYQHNLKMLFSFSLFKNIGWNAVMKRVETLNRIDKIERSYEKSILDFNKEDFEKMYRDLMVVGLNSYTVQVDLKHCFDFIQFSTDVNEKYDIGLEITSVSFTDIKKLYAQKVEIKDSILDYSEFMNILKYPMIPADIRLGMLFDYKGIGFKDSSVMDIRFQDFLFEKDSAYLVVSEGDSSRRISFHGEEADVLKCLIDIQKFELEKAIWNATGERFFTSSAAVIYNINLKKKVEKIISPVTFSAFKKRYNKFLNQLNDESLKHKLKRKIIRKNGFANAVCERIENGESFYTSIIKTMYQFNEINEEQYKSYLEDSDLIDSLKYRKAKAKVMIFGDPNITNAK